MNRTHQLAFAQLTLAVVFWGASFIATKIALRDVSPFTVIWLRFAMGVLILGGAVLARREFKLVSRHELPYLLLLGFLGITFHQWLQANGLVTARATTTAWIVSTTPVFIAVLSLLFLQERLGPARVIGILLAAAGVLLVVSRGDWSTLAIGQFGEPGDILILVSAVNWAVFSVLSRRGLSRQPPARMMFYVMLIGWLLTSLPFAASAGISEIPRLTRDGWLAIGFLGIFCSGFAYIFWYDALGLLPASQVGVFLYIEPLVSLVVAALVLAEPITAAGLAGGALILFGVWLVNRQSRAKETENAIDAVSQDTAS